MGGAYLGSKLVAGEGDDFQARALVVVGPPQGRELSVVDMGQASVRGHVDHKADLAWSIFD